MYVLLYLSNVFFSYPSLDIPFFFWGGEGGKVLHNYVFDIIIYSYHLYIQAISYD